MVYRLTIKIIMCTVSMIGDEFSDRWKKYVPNPLNSQQPFNPLSPHTPTFTGPVVTKQEFDDLKKEVELMKSLLKRAKIYDEQNGEPNCEMEDKIKLLKQIAEFVGVDLSEVFGNGKTNL